MWGGLGIITVAPLAALPLFGLSCLLPRFALTRSRFGLMASDDPAWPRMASDGPILAPYCFFGGKSILSSLFELHQLMAPELFIGVGRW